MVPTGMVVIVVKKDYVSGVLSMVLDFQHVISTYCCCSLYWGHRNE